METLKSIVQWHAAARPEPTLKQLSVQVGCHLEEVAEMLATLPVPGERVEYVRQCMDIVATLAHSLKSGKIPLREPSRDEKVALLDALCDQVVTAAGVAHCAGLDILGGLAEVNSSNWSKFVDGKPLFDENGKITKGPNYRKADLKGFVGE